MAEPGRPLVCWRASRIVIGVGSADAARKPGRYRAIGASRSSVAGIGEAQDRERSERLRERPDDERSFGGHRAAGPVGRTDDMELRHATAADDGDRGTGVTGVGHLGVEIGEDGRIVGRGADPAGDWQAIDDDERDHTDGEEDPQSCGT